MAVHFWSYLIDSSQNPLIGVGTWYRFKSLSLQGAFTFYFNPHCDLKKQQITVFFSHTNIQKLFWVAVCNCRLNTVNSLSPSTVFFSSLVDSDNNAHVLIWILLLHIPGYVWQWLPAALWLLLYARFKALFQRGAGSENSLYTNDSLISCFLAFVAFLQTEMCVQILIKRWASLCCLLPLKVPLDWTPANQAIYFPPALFFLPCEKSIQRFFFSLCCYKSLLISVLIWQVARNGRPWPGNTAFPASVREI